MSRLKRKVKKFIHLGDIGHEPDKGLIIVVFIILLFGLVALSSASSVVAYDKFGDAYYYFKHQFFGLILGLVAFWLSAFLYRSVAFGFYTGYSGRLRFCS